MANPACEHKWTVTNLRSGYLIVEGCFHCRHRISYFSDEPVPPIDDYQEGSHFWSYLGDFQASKFDLKCDTCGAEVPLKDVMSTLLCMRCDPQCGVYKAGSDKAGHRVWAYVALCADTSHTSAKCVDEDEIKALNEYFNSGLTDASKRIVVVPCGLRRLVDTCHGVVIADVGLTDIY